jgi:hypothetical protein
MRRSVCVFLLTILIVLTLCGAPVAAENGEQVLFSAVSPDAMVVLDLSGSMRWNPKGEFDLFQEPVRRYGNDACSGEVFYETPQAGFATDCARYLIAKRAIYKILDDNKDGTIDVRDEAGLNIRFGFWKFSSGNKRHRNLGEPYASIWCGNGSCPGIETNLYTGEDTVLYWTDSTRENERISGSTGLASCMDAVNVYLEGSKTEDPYRKCRQKFVILVTDGQDTLFCSGNGSGSQADQYKRRRASVAKVKILRDAGYRVFVIGLGDRMPDFLNWTLNWMAYYGGTANPFAEKKGNPSALNIGSIVEDPCSSSATESPVPGGCSGSSEQCFAVTNDPGNLELTGYAFVSTNAKELEAALRQAVTHIRDAVYSFSAPSVALTRTSDENHLYAASFQPGHSDPFWKGSLKKYAILPDQSVGDVLGDAGAVLQGIQAGERNLLTARGGSLISFSTSTLSASDLGVSEPTRRDEIVGYIRGEGAYNPDQDSGGNVWKLGDIFHSNPVTVVSPSAHFADPRDKARAFETYRLNNQRTSTNQKRIVVAGANDGQLHAFRTSDLREVWSFIPPNLLDRLKDISHKEHPAGLLHQYFVDGPVTVADVWTGAGDGKFKAPVDWQTILVVGLGRGGANNLWSSSSTCDSGFSRVYLSNGDYPYFCGYHALDITDTLNPVYRWRLRVPASQAPYLGDPWSRMVVRRVRIGGNEKWVGFVGGGHHSSACAGNAECDARGKAFFAVDMATGNVLWSFNRNSPNGGAMNYALPSMAAVIDSDMDGFVDRAYIGDLGGNMWRFSFCRASDGEGCTTADWKGSLLYRRDDMTGPVYHAPAVARHVNGSFWIYWGTGDRLEPAAGKNYRDLFVAVRDPEKLTSLAKINLQPISDPAMRFTEFTTKDGWVIELGGAGEKVLSEPTVFAGVVHFTTYTPESGGADPCEQTGDAKLYSLSFVDGAGTFAGNARSVPVGRGIASGPWISAGPEAGKGGMFGVTSGGAATSGAPWSDPGRVQWPAGMTHLLHWRDTRIR